jgi:multidrug efflux system outer membrane protein
VSAANTRLPWALWACALLLLLADGCAVGPDYRRPDVKAPEAYSEAGPWKVAEPRDSLPKAGWWTVFQDPVLDGLETSAAAASPTLRAALARYDEALAAARSTRGVLYPTLSANPSASREGYSANRQTEYPSTRFAYTTNSFDLPLDISYEVDLFGAARRAVESARAAAESQGATYQNVLLSLEAGVARNYFTLRSLEAQRELLTRNISLLKDALELVRKLRKGGANSDLDVYQAETELETVESSAVATDRAIAEQQHALAVLIGQNPESFRIAPAPLASAAPAVPVGLPSELLERRPDVAAAERNLASVNARIGAAKAAFFPSIGLTAFAGANSSDLSNLLTWGSREWAAGPFVTVPIFNGGTNLANYHQAKAAYEEALADYRQQVLVAFQEVEDGLSDLRLLANETSILESAVASSSGASKLSIVRYKSGLVSYIEVIDSQRTQLASELSLTQARADRLSATVQLIRALGGGW